MIWHYVGLMVETSVFIMICMLTIPKVVWLWKEYPWWAFILLVILALIVLSLMGVLLGMWLMLTCSPCLTIATRFRSFNFMNGKFCFAFSHFSIPMAFDARLLFAIHQNQKSKSYFSLWLWKCWTTICRRNSGCESNYFKSCDCSSSNVTSNQRWNWCSVAHWQWMIIFEITDDANTVQF